MNYELIPIFYAKQTLPVEFPIFTAMVVLICSFFIAQTFSGVLDVVTETNLICLVCDQEMFTGRQRFVYKMFLDFMAAHG